MAVDYISVEDAIGRGGLRMVVVGGVPSPWGEAAKGILHIKGIDWAAVRLVYDDDRLTAWAGQRSGPVAIYNDEPPRSGWAEILSLAERLAPTPALTPEDAEQRALMLDLAGDICGEGGLGWTRRVQLVHAGLNGAGGFAEPVAQYIGQKYGYSPEAGAAAGGRVADLLGRLAARLKAQHDAGSAFYVGQAVTALDVYSATFMALFAPLPPEQCDMNPRTRQAFATLDAQTEAALDPILLQHRDRTYDSYLALPLSL